MQQRRRVLVAVGSCQPDVVEERAALAARAVEEGSYYNLVVFAGWKGECQRLYDGALRHGMPTGQPIDMEELSRDTNQNAAFVARRLLHQGGRDEPTELYRPTDEVWLVTSPWHAPRAWASFAAYFDNVGVVFEGKPWNLGKRDFERFLREEVPGIEAYARQGYLAPWSRAPGLVVKPAQIRDPEWYGRQALNPPPDLQQGVVPFAVPLVSAQAEIVIN